MPPLTIATADAALKQIYRPGYLNDVCFKDKPLLAMLPKFTKFGGRNLPVVMEYGKPQGRSVQFATAQTNATPSLFEDFLLTRVSNYCVTQVTGETVDAMGEDSYSFIRGLSNQIDGAMQTLSRDMHHAAYRNGRGQRGVGDGAWAIAGLVCTLNDPEDASNFEVGMVVTSTAAGFAGAINPGSVTLGAVDRLAGTLTSAAGNWNAAGNIPLIANTDVLFQEGDYLLAGDLLKMSGLDAWCPAAAAPGAALFFGVNRTADVTRLGGLRYNGAALTPEEALINGQSLCAQFGGKPTHCFLHHTKYRDLENSLGARVQYELVQSGHKGTQGVIGFESIKIQGNKGPIFVIPDEMCQTDYAWMLQLDTWCLNSLGEAPKILQHDGNRILRQGAADGVEVRCGAYANISCLAPGYNCAITMP